MKVEYEGYIIDKRYLCSLQFGVGVIEINELRNIQKKKLFWALCVKYSAYRKMALSRIKKQYLVK